MIGAMRSRLLIPMAVLVAAAGCGGMQQPSPAAPPPERSAKSPGKETPQEARRDAAPDFTITTFTGDRFSLAEQRGTPVVLNFWESW